jgi:hypothetical protein
MRLTSSVFALLFLAACGQVSAGAGRPSPFPPSPSVTAVASPTPTAAPSPAISGLPITALSFSCRLPFVHGVGSGSQAGFFDFPSGAFTLDPTAPPSAMYYDRAVSRWLPVGRFAVAPDGGHYAYTTGGTFSVTPGPPRLHVVDAATGADRVIDLGLLGQPPYVYAVEDYAADGIYIGNGYEGPSNWYWRVDPASGIITDLGKQAHFVDDGTGHAWVSVIDSRDPNPARGAMAGEPLPNEVVRRNLTTGADEVWFYHAGFSVSLVGAFVGGGLLVLDQAGYPADPNAQHLVVSTPGTSRVIASGGDLFDLGSIDGTGKGLADSHGLWLGSYDELYRGLYLFTRDGTVKRVSDLLGAPANGCL